MNIASAGRHGLAYAPETSPGVLPSVPVLTALRHTSCALGVSRDTLTSDEKRPDRQISDVRSGADKVAGSLGFELSYGEYDPLLEAALAGTWTNNVLDCGVTERSVTLERRFADIGQYIVHKGCFVNKVNLSIKPNAFVSGSFDIVGLEGAISATPLAASPVASQSERPYDSYTGTLSEGDTIIGVVTGLEFALDNGIQPQYVIFRRAAPFVTYGRANLTGTLTAFFASPTMIQKFLSDTPSRLEFTIGDGLSRSYKVLIPQVRYTGADVPMQSDGPLTVSMPFSGVLDPDLGTNLRITRIPGASVPSDPDLS